MYFLHKAINKQSKYKLLLWLQMDEGSQGGLDLFLFLANNGGGERSLHLGLKIIQLGLEGKDGVIDLFLVVSVDTGSGEDSNPGEGEDGEAVHDGAKVGEEVHGNSELRKIKFWNISLDITAI